MTDQSVIMPKPAEKETDKRRAILAAARGLLIERGFQDVALDDVAKKAGVAKGTLFLYYKSKEELFGAAFSDLVESLGEKLETLAASPASGRARLEQAVELVLGHFEENRDFMALVGARFPGCGDRSSERLTSKFAANLARMAAVLAPLVKEGLLKKGDLQATAGFLFSLCRSSILYNMMTKSDRPLALRRAQVLDMFLDGARKR